MGVPQFTRSFQLSRMSERSSSFEKFAVVVVGSRDYDIRQKLLTIASNMNRFNFFNILKKKFAVVVVGSRDHSFNPKPLTWT